MLLLSGLTAHKRWQVVLLLLTISAPLSDVNLQAVGLTLPHTVELVLLHLPPLTPKMRKVDSLCCFDHKIDRWDLSSGPAVDGDPGGEKNRFFIFFRFSWFNMNSPMIVDRR